MAVAILQTIITTLQEQKTSLQEIVTTLQKQEIALQTTVATLQEQETFLQLRVQALQTSKTQNRSVVTKIYFGLVNFKSLIALYCGVVAPNADFTYILTSTEMSMIPVNAE